MKIITIYITIKMSNRFKKLVGDTQSPSKKFTKEKEEPKLTRWNRNNVKETSNRFKSSGRNLSQKKEEEPKLALNSRWKRNDNEDEKDSQYGSGRGDDRGENRKYGSSRRDDRDENRKYGGSSDRRENSGDRYGDRKMRGGDSGSARYGDRNNRNNFNRKYKAGYKRVEGPAPCAADRFGINFKNLEKFKKVEKTKDKKIEKKQAIKIEEIIEELSKDEIATTLALAEQYQYQTESEEELDDEDAKSVDSMENWKPRHI